MRTLFIIPLVLVSLTSLPSWSDEIVFDAKLSCAELSAKSFSVNGEITNVKMDGEGLEVVVNGRGDNALSTRYPSSSTKDYYESVVSLLHEDANGNQILNAQFVAKNGGIFGTKTVTLTYQQSTGNWFMISSEPFALGTSFPAIRTHFHKCFPKE